MTLRAFRDDDRAARQRHGWHREIERGYGADTPTRPMTDDEVRGLGRLPRTPDAPPAPRAGRSSATVSSSGAAFLFDVREAGARRAWRSACTRRSSSGRGLGTEAIRLVLRHAFGTLGMHRVDLKVLDFNARAIAAYRACGFVEEGRERESCWVDGRWHDDVIMGVLDREFAALDARDSGSRAGSRGCRRRCRSAGVASTRQGRDARGRGRAAGRGGPPRPWRRR